MGFIDLGSIRLPLWFAILASAILSMLSLIVIVVLFMAFIYPGHGISLSDNQVVRVVYGPSGEVLKLLPSQYHSTKELRRDDGQKGYGRTLGFSVEEGYCVLSAVSGRFDALKERVAVYPTNYGEWVYDWDYGAAHIAARIDCYTHPKLQAVPLAGKPL